MLEHDLRHPHRSLGRSRSLEGGWGHAEHLGTSFSLEMWFLMCPVCLMASLGNTSPLAEEYQFQARASSSGKKSTGNSIDGCKGIRYGDKEGNNTEYFWRGSGSRQSTAQVTTYTESPRDSSPLAASWAHNRPVAQRARLRSRCVTIRPRDCGVVSLRPAHIFPGSCHHNGSTHPQPRGLSALPPSIPGDCY